jgi:hypothetical protein
MTHNLRVYDESFIERAQSSEVAITSLKFSTGSKHSDVQPG